MLISIFNYLLSFQLMFGLLFINRFIPASTGINIVIKSFTLIFYFCLISSKLEFKKKIKFKPIVFISFAFYIFYYFLHDFNEADPYYSLVKYAIIFIGIRFLISNLKNYNRCNFSTPIAISGTFIIIFIFLSYLPIGISTNFSIRPHFESMTGFNINSNTLAQISIVSILIFLDKLKSLSVEKKYNFIFLIKFIFLPLLFIFVVITQSISNIIFLIIIFFTVAYERAKIKSSSSVNLINKLIQPIIYTLGIILFLISISSNILTQFFERLFTGGSFLLRLPLLIDTISEFMKSPIFGTSHNGFIKATSLITGGGDGITIMVTSNHTYYANILAIYGLIGFTAMIFLFYSVFFIGFKKRNIYEKLLILFFLWMPIFSPIYFFLPISLALNDKK